MIKYLNQKPKLYIVTSLFISITLILFAIRFNIVYGQFGPYFWDQLGDSCSYDISAYCGDVSTCYGQILPNNDGNLECISNGNCTTPPLPPPEPFECNNMDVSYIERLPDYEVHGLHASIRSNGKYTVKGMTSNGVRNCSEILNAISSFDYGSCAYPSSVSEERLERVSWSFNDMRTVRDCGNVTAIWAECDDASQNYGASPGFITRGSIASPYSAFTEHITALQNAAPYQGGLYDGNIYSKNDFPAPFYNINNLIYEPLKLAFNYEMVYSHRSGYHTRCWCAFWFFWCQWQECNRTHEFTHIPRVLQPNVDISLYQVMHRDRSQSPIFRNSPIRKSWQIQNANSGSCNIETKDDLNGNVISALSRNAINIDPLQNTQTFDFLPIDVATGQYLANVDQAANYTIGYDPSRIQPGSYTSSLSCNISIDCTVGSPADDCKRTYPINPYTSGVGVDVFAYKSFTISSDITTVNLKAVAKPSIVSKKNIRTKIEATTTGAGSGDTHKYKIKLPQGYRVTSNPERVVSADVAGSSTVSWDVELDINTTTNSSVAQIGTSQFVIEMIDEPYDNLYTAKTQVTYLGSRNIKEVAP